MKLVVLLLLALGLASCSAPTSPEIRKPLADTLATGAAAQQPAD